MKTCGRCEKQRVVSITLDDSMDVCGHTFTATLAAEKCESCGQISIQGHEVKLFELRIAVELAKAGPRTGECFKYLRKSLGVEPEGLAQLLDVSADVIGYWETGRWPVDPRAQAVLSSLVLGKYDHSPASLDCIAVLRVPRRLARKVRLTLIDAIGHARKALQFGSAARTAAVTA